MPAKRIRESSAPPRIMSAFEQAAKAIQKEDSAKLKDLSGEISELSKSKKGKLVWAAVQKGNLAVLKTLSSILPVSIEDLLNSLNYVVVDEKPERLNVALYLWLRLDCPELEALTPRQQTAWGKLSKNLGKVLPQQTLKKKNPTEKAKVFLAVMSGDISALSELNENGVSFDRLAMSNAVGRVSNAKTEEDRTRSLDTVLWLMLHGCPPCPMAVKEKLIERLV